MERKKRCKRLLAFLLTAVMVFSSQAMMVFADPATYVLIDGSQTGSTPGTTLTSNSPEGESEIVPAVNDSLPEEDNGVKVTFYKANPQDHPDDESNKIGEVTVFEAATESVAGDGATGESAGSSDPGEGSASPAGRQGMYFSEVLEKFNAAYPGHEGLTWQCIGNDNGVETISDPNDKWVGADEDGHAKDLEVWVQPVTVKFWMSEEAAQKGEENQNTLIEKFEEVAYGTVLSELIEQLYVNHSDYKDITWNLGDGYVITGDTDVWASWGGESIEVIDNETGATKKYSIGSNNDGWSKTGTGFIQGVKGKNNLTIKLLDDVMISHSFNLNFGGTASNSIGTGCTLDLQGHTFTNKYGSSSVVTIEAGTVTIKNGVISGGERSPGINMIGGTLTANNLTITDTKEYGVSVTKNATAFLSECEILNAKGKGLKADASGATATLTDCKVSGAKDGGVHLTNGAVGFLTDCEISGNECSASYQAAGITVQRSKLQMNGGVVEKNINNGGNSYAAGGVYAADGGSIINITGTQIINNTAKSLGGGICTLYNTGSEEEATELVLKKVRVAENTAKSGGGIYTEGFNITWIDCNLNDNTTTGEGENCIDINLNKGQGPSLSIIGGSLSNNSAKNSTQSDEGNAVYIAGSTNIETSVFVQGINISGNKANNVFYLANVKNANLTGCNISGNNSRNATVVSNNTNLTVEGCEINSNKAIYAGGIKSTNGTLILKNSQVVNNIIEGIQATGTGNMSSTGGVYVAIGTLTVDEESVVYGNGHQREGTEKKGGDFYFTDQCEISLPAASEMSDGVYSIWEVNQKSPKEGGMIKDLQAQIDDPLDISLISGENLGLTAANGYSVARFVDKTGNPVKNNNNEEIKYTTVQDALTALEHPETLTSETGKSADEVKEFTIQLLDGNGKGVVTEGTIMIHSDAGNVKLDMNGLTLKLGNALLIEEGADFTITDSNTGTELSAILSSTKDYAVENAGTLTVEDPVSLSVKNTRETTETDDGSRLTVNAEADLSKVSLARENVVQVTGNNGENLNPISVKVVDEILTDVNVGKGTVTMFRGEEGVLTEEFRSRVSLDGANKQVEIKFNEDSTEIYAGSPALTGVYVDGAKGSDEPIAEEVRGMTPEAPLKTFEAAKQLLKEIQDGENPLEKPCIYVMGTITVSENTEWSLSDIPRASVVRYPSFVKALVRVAGGSLSLRNITMDGYDVPAEEAMIWAESGTELGIHEGTVLENNLHTMSGRGYTYSGGAVYNGGAVVMDGGTIRNNQAHYGGGIELWGSGAKLMMNGGTIEGNKAVITSEANNPAGGAVAVLFNASMTMDGGSISGNRSDYDGGGISVGAPMENTIGNNTVLHMNGGTVSENWTGLTGGGIFVQSRTKAYIYGGTISGNHCNGSFRGTGQYGGGGIYVNGTRTATNGVYKMGELYLERAIISGNSSKGGQGFAGCGTSETKIYLTSGCAIVENGSTSDDQVLVANKGRTYISKFLLGGYAYNWKDEEGNPFDVKELEYNNGEERRIGNDPEPGYPTTAPVMITGNSSDAYGGGIGSNGYVQFGEEGPRVTVDFEKELLGREWKDTDTFEFELRRVNGDGEYSDVQKVTADKTHRKFSLKTDEFEKAGTYVYELRELDTDILAVENDDTVYEIIVEVVGDDVSKSGLGAYISDVRVKGSSEPVSQVKFTNTFAGSVTLTKRGAESTPENLKLLAGAQFQLYYRTDETENWELYGDASYVTEEDGTLNVDGLPAGDYYFVETKAPAGYEITTDADGNPLQYPFTIGPDGGDEVIHAELGVTNETEPETETETETEPETEPQTQPETEPQTQPETEPQTQPQAVELTVTKQLAYENELWNAVDETFYVALYSDAALTDRVTDIQPIVFQDSNTSSTTFTGLEYDRTYYVGETNDEGVVLNTMGGVIASGQSFSVDFNEGNAATLTREDGTQEITFRNMFAELPPEFYREGTLTVTKRLLGADGVEKAADRTFYAGIFSDAGYTQLSSDVNRNIVELALNGSSMATATVTVTVPQSGSMTVYVTEVDRDGKPVEGAASFQYDVTVEGATITMDEENLSGETVITNQEREEETEEETELETESIKKDKDDGDEIVPATTSSVKTGDETPLGLYIGLMAAAAALILLLFAVRRKRGQK